MWSTTIIIVDETRNLQLSGLSNFILTQLVDHNQKKIHIIAMKEIA